MKCSSHMTFVGFYRCAIQAVYAISVLPSNMLVSASKDKTLRIWNTETGDCTTTLTGHTGVFKLHYHYNRSFYTNLPPLFSFIPILPFLLSLPLLLSLRPLLFPLSIPLLPLNLLSLSLHFPSLPLPLLHPLPFSISLPLIATLS